jgi:hypothetical protein
MDCCREPSALPCSSIPAVRLPIGRSRAAATAIGRDIEIFFTLGRRTDVVAGGLMSYGPIAWGAIRQVAFVPHASSRASIVLCKCGSDCEPHLRLALFFDQLLRRRAHGTRVPTAREKLESFFREQESTRTGTFYLSLSAGFAIGAATMWTTRLPSGTANNRVKKPRFIEVPKAGMIRPE